MKKLAEIIISFTIGAFLASCGSATSSSAPTAQITGVVDTSAVAKPSVRSATTLGGVTVDAVNPDGTTAATFTTNSDGSYTLTVPQNGTYVIRVTSGSVVLKAVAAVGTTGVTADVNPGSTAVLLVLAQNLGVPTMGDNGTKFSSQVSTMTKDDIDQAVNAIKGDHNFSAIAAQVHDDLKNCINPSEHLSHGQAAILASAGNIHPGHHGQGGGNTSSGSNTNTNTNTGTNAGAGHGNGRADAGTVSSTDSGTSTDSSTSSSTSSSTGSSTGTSTGGFCRGHGGGSASGSSSVSGTKTDTDTKTGTSTI